jgi:DNA-binding NarL/FixJ family response regulator
MAKKSRHDSLPNAFINIVGRNMLQNELLLSFLKKETGLKGTCLTELESITQVDSDKPEISQLILLDCKHVDMKNLWEFIHKRNHKEASQCFYVLCNVEPATGIEKDAMDNGIKGVFYNNDPLPLIAKGICKVLQGDLWYSRIALTKCLLESRSSTNSLIHPATAHLTFRERQMLSYIASGYSSKAISDELNISIHTVKAHIYSLYKKINVNTRLQASLWAAKYL